MITITVRLIQYKYDSTTRSTLLKNIPNGFVQDWLGNQTSIQMETFEEYMRYKVRESYLVGTNMVHHERLKMQSAKCSCTVVPTRKNHFQHFRL